MSPGKILIRSKEVPKTVELKKRKVLYYNELSYLCALSTVGFEKEEVDNAFTRILVREKVGISQKRFDKLLKSGELELPSTIQEKNKTIFKRNPLTPFDPHMLFPPEQVIHDYELEYGNLPSEEEQERRRKKIEAGWTPCLIKEAVNGEEYSLFQQIKESVEYEDGYVSPCDVEETMDRYASVFNLPPKSIIEFDIVEDELLLLIREKIHAIACKMLWHAVKKQKDYLKKYGKKARVISRR